MNTNEFGKPAEDKTVKTIIGAVMLVIIVLIFLALNPFYVVNAGERAVILNFGAVQEKIIGEGLHMRMPIYQKVIKVNVKTQTIAFDNSQKEGDSAESSSLFAASKDLQDVQIATVVNYHQDPMKVNDIYQKYGMSYESNVIAPIIRETVKSVSAQYTAEELVTKRTIFSDNISRVLTERLIEKDAVMERFNVVNFEFSKSFNQAIEAKVTAEQNALAAKNKLEQVKFEAQQQIEQAKGKAEAINVEANALQDNPQVLELRALERWNGILPQYVGGGAPIPFIDITK